MGHLQYIITLLLTLWHSFYPAIFRMVSPGSSGPLERCCSCKDSGWCMPRVWKGLQSAIALTLKVLKMLRVFECISVSVMPPIIWSDYLISRSLTVHSSSCPLFLSTDPPSINHCSVAVTTHTLMLPYQRAYLSGITEGTEEKWRKMWINLVWPM